MRFAEWEKININTYTHTKPSSPPKYFGKWKMWQIPFSPLWQLWHLQKWNHKTVQVTPDGVLLMCNNESQSGWRDGCIICAMGIGAVLWLKLPVDGEDVFTHCLVIPWFFKKSGYCIVWIQPNVISSNTVEHAVKAYYMNTIVCVAITLHCWPLLNLILWSRELTRN